MITTVCHIIGTVLAYLEIAFWVIGLLIVGIFALGLYILAAIGILMGGGTDGDYTSSTSLYDTGESCHHDEDMYACADEWRLMHPYDYNPYTGGSSKEQDEERK